MKILHTADWHIGKSLYKFPLYEDMELFFEELIEVIENKKIDVIIVAGDIFDLANPSNKDKEIYFKILAKLMLLRLKIVITAGNHDSARMIEGPAELLKYLNIHVVGQGQDIEKQIIPIFLDESPQIPEVIILAVPFLRDRDVVNSSAGDSTENKITALKNGIINHYDQLISTTKTRFPKIPILAMGHLYLQGASASESEREIQMGTLDGISVHDFASEADYVALGHIHRPQKLHPEGKIRYSGSPIALSFSEREDEKQLIILEIKDHKVFNVETFKLQKYRYLKRFSGTLEDVKAQILGYKNTAPLKTYVEIQVIEKEHDRSKIIELQDFSVLKSDAYEIITSRITFDQQKHHFLENRSDEYIEDLNPTDVFKSKIEETVQNDVEKTALLSVFKELMEVWSEKQSE